MVELIFGGLNINNKQCPTFTSIYLEANNVMSNTESAKKFTEHIMLVLGLSLFLLTFWVQ